MYMKKLLLMIIAMAISTTIYGQQINQSNNSYRGDDIMEKRDVSTDVPDLINKNDIWSLENAEISGKAFNQEYTTEKDTLMLLERGNRTYYLQKAGQICIIGSENAQELIGYDMPETWLKFPIQLGDSISGYFNGTGKYCDRLFMRRFGTYLTKADAVGCIVLPGGDSLSNVLRLHTKRYVSNIYAPIDTMKRQIPAFTTDSIIRYMTADTMLIREDIYRWYAEGYRYPVLEAKIVSQNEENHSEEIFYYAPEIQEQLVLDDENRNTRARLAADNTRDEDNKKNGSLADFTYHFSQDEDSETVTISYVSDQPVKVVILLTNYQGYIYRQTSQTDGTPINLCYNGLRRGQYILRIDVGSQHFAEKFNVK